MTNTIEEATYVRQVRMGRLRLAVAVSLAVATATSCSGDHDKTSDRPQRNASSIHGVPVVAGASAGAGTTIGASFKVAAGSELIGAAFPQPSAAETSSKPAGWHALLLVYGEPTTVIADYLRQATMLGLPTTRPDCSPKDRTCFGEVWAGKPLSSRGLTYSFERNTRPSATSYLLLRYYGAVGAGQPAVTTSAGAPSPAPGGDWQPLPSEWPPLRQSGARMFRSDLDPRENPRMLHRCAEVAPSARFRDAETFLLVGVVRCSGSVSDVLAAYDGELRRLGYRRVNGAGIHGGVYATSDVGVTLLTATRAGGAYAFLGVRPVT